MKKIKVVISILLVLIITVSSVVSTSALSSADVLRKSIYEEKISPELQSTLENLDADDKVKVAVWLYDIESEEKDTAFTNHLLQEKEKGNISVELYSDSMLYGSGSKSRSQQLSVNEAQILSSIKRSSYKELHVDRNNKWKNSLGKKSDVTKVIYVSNYAPVVFIETEKSRLNEIALSDEVEYVYPFNDEMVPYNEDIQTENNSINSNSSDSVDYGEWQNNTSIYTMRDVMGYDGSGIKIGLLENGLPDVNNESGVFENSNVICINQDDPDGHATGMAAILVGKTDDYTGVVPNAELYCAGYVGDYITSIDALIENDINILSISLGLGYNSGVFNTYGSYSKYLDYIVYNYNITVCMAAGNYDSNPGVPEGAMGYNLITVGCLDDKNTSTYTDDEISSYSSYVTSSFEAYKPDVCAPGARAGTPDKIAVVENGLGGTSRSTPIVAGICAMLMEAEPSLVGRPMLLKSILMSSAKRLPNMDSPMSTATSTAPALSRSYGAGLVDVTRAYKLVEDEKWNYIPLVTAEQSQNPYTMDITISQKAINSSKKLAVSLNWTQKVLATSLSDATVYDVYHHDLGVYDPNGNLVAYSNYQYDRKQFVYFQPSVAGTYQIRVFKTGIAQAGVLTAISYNLS